ncbi:MAG: Tetratricopeptide repeat protein [Methanosaeta sp. PtaB.Bin039]|nr:MAG: Tetratricopeptide repeat protein [Methanosaeta sp. PtaB.Bin039]OPY46777.1 MAG: Tetratricopeptide repeat protein [Methanosaeta sp. PtaU1.Bin028]
MDQLVVLHEIFESFAKGKDSLHTLDPASVQGKCASRVRRLLESCLQGQIDRAACSDLAECFTDVYELKRLGDICRRAGILDIALRCYHKALSAASEHHVRAVLLNNLGQVQARQGDLNKAILYYKKAVDAFEYSGSPSGVAHVLGNLGSAYRRGYNWDLAVENCFKSLKAFEKLADEFGVAQMTGSLGRVYAEMGELDLSVLYFERSQKEFQRLGDRRSAAWVMNRLGRAYSDQHRWEDADQSFRSSLGVFDELGQPHNSGVVLCNLGRSLLDRGDLSRSQQTLEQGLKLIRTEMQPAYPNAVAALSAAYSWDAWNKLTGSESAKEAGARAISQQFARASDGYSQLSTSPRVSLTELKVVSSLNRSLSYLALLSADPRDEQAVSFAERAISALDAAVANSGGSERIRLTAVQRCLVGLKEVWAVGVFCHEPWKMMKMVCASSEYLMGGARDLGEFSEACRHVFEALRSISGSLEEDRQRRDPSPQLAGAALQLRRAERRFGETDTAFSKRIASRISLAAETLEKLAEGDQSSAPDILNYTSHRRALLMIGWALVESGFSLVGKNDWLYVWDDSMNLTELGPASQPQARQKIERKKAYPSSEWEEPSPWETEESASETDVPAVEIFPSTRPQQSADLGAAVVTGGLVPVPAGAASAGQVQVVRPALNWDHVKSTTDYGHQTPWSSGPAQRSHVHSWMEEEVASYQYPPPRADFSEAPGQIGTVSEDDDSASVLERFKGLLHLPSIDLGRLSVDVPLVMKAAGGALFLAVVAYLLIQGYLR